MTDPSAPPRTRRAAEAAGGTGLVLVAVLLLSVNLRPAAVSVGPVLAEVRAGLGMSEPVAGVLTSLPVIAFAVFGALAPTVGRRIGPHRTTLAALIAATIGLAGRSVAGRPATFLALSMVALAGLAMANVLLPSLVKLHFPDRIGAVTAAYTTALAVGLTSSLVLTVPIAEAAGGWRSGLGGWAVLAGVATLAWLLLARRDTTRPEAGPRPGYLAVVRTPLARAMVMLFGLQSLQAYAVFGWFAQLWRDHDYSATDAGLLVGLLAAVSIPLSLVLPRILARLTRPALLLIPVLACYPLGYAALLAAPHALAVPAAIVVGIGQCTFPMVLTLIGLRARTPEGTAGLSAVTQSLGYLLAAVGPFLVGVLHDASGDWTVPLLVLIGLSLPLFPLAVVVSRPTQLEDQLN